MLQSPSKDNSVAFANVKAIAHFIGQDKEKLDLREFKNWYSPKTVTHLIHCQPKMGKVLRAYFISQTNAALTQEINNFLMLSNSLNRPGLFVFQEPEAGQHFIFGIVYQGKLLIINPLGKTQHKEILSAFSKTGLEVIQSNTIIQLDRDGIVSCGPICVELLHHFTQVNISDLFKSLKPTKDDAGYNDVYIKDFLPPQLKKLVFEEYSEHVYNEYVHHLINIRAQHLQNLQQACSAFPTEKQMNEFFDENCMNCPEQVLIYKLATDKTFNIMSLMNDKEYNKLEAEPLIPAPAPVVIPVVPVIPAPVPPLVKPQETIIEPQPVQQPVVNKTLPLAHKLLLGLVTFALCATIGHFAIGFSLTLTLISSASFAFLATTIAAAHLQQGLPAVNVPSGPAVPVANNPSQTPLFDLHKQQVKDAQPSANNNITDPNPGTGLRLRN